MWFTKQSTVQFCSFHSSWIEIEQALFTLQVSFSCGRHMTLSEGPWAFGRADRSTAGKLTQLVLFVFPSWISDCWLICSGTAQCEEQWRINPSVATCWGVRWGVGSKISCHFHGSLVKGGILFRNVKCYLFNFGQWPQAAAQVQIWDVLEEAQGDFAWIMCRRL